MEMKSMLVTAFPVDQGYKLARCEEVSMEMNSMLVTVGWKKWRRAATLATKRRESAVSSH